MRPKAFTLVELLVVIGIVAVLIAILLPVLSSAQQMARSARASSDLRQLTLGYLQYSIDNRGGLPFGYPPAQVNNWPVTADMPDGTVVGAPTSQRYPWRLIRYVSNAWAMVYYDAPAVPDDEYVKGLCPQIGLNSVFLGGHDNSRYRGYMGFAPNVGKHIAFKASEIRRPSQQIVFAESRAKNAIEYDGALHDGYFYLLPPRGNSPAANKRWWNLTADGTRATTTSTSGGLPNGRFGKRTLTPFFDGHVAGMTVKELDDMRYWAPRATSADYDFSP